MSHIFISYSRKNLDCARKIARQFEAKGFKVWIDLDSIEGGTDWRGSIQSAIPQAAAMLLLWSDDSKKSLYVKKEVELALNESFIRPDFRIIPALMSDLTAVPLWEEIKNLNGRAIYTCSTKEIADLIDEFAKFVPPTRRKLDFDRAKPLGDHAGKIGLSRVPLVAVPCMESVYCNARVIGRPETVLNHLPTNPLTVQVLLEFLGNPTTETTIQQVYDYLQETQPTKPVFLIHVTGPAKGDKYMLSDDQSGDWLDAVNTTHAALDWLAGRGATLQLFNAIPASLNFAIGMQFYNFYRVQAINRTPPPDSRYVVVLDTNDL